MTHLYDQYQRQVITGITYSHSLTIICGSRWIDKILEKYYQDSQIKIAFRKTCLLRITQPQCPVDA